MKTLKPKENITAQQQGQNNREQTCIHLKKGKNLLSISAHHLYKKSFGLVLQQIYSSLSHINSRKHGVAEGHWRWAERMSFHETEP